MGRTRRENNGDFRKPRFRPYDEEEKWSERDYWENEEEQEEDLDFIDSDYIEYSNDEE